MKNHYIAYTYVSGRANLFHTIFVQNRRVFGYTQHFEGKSDCVVRPEIQDGREQRAFRR